MSESALPVHPGGRPDIHCCFLSLRHARSGAGAGGPPGWLPPMPGAARYASRPWRAQRAPGRGEGQKGGAGGNSETRGFGGFPVSPRDPCRLPPARNTARYLARALFRSRRAARTAVLALSPVICAAGSVVLVAGRRGQGNLEPGP